MLPLTRVVKELDSQGAETLPSAVTRTLPAMLSVEVTRGVVTRHSYPHDDVSGGQVENVDFNPTGH